MALQNGTANLFFMSPDKAHPAGKVTFKDGHLSGEGQRGIRFEGTYRSSLDGGIDVDVTATVPKGTAIDADLATPEEVKHQLSFI